MEDGCPSADRCVPAPAPIYLLVQLVDPSVPLSLSLSLSLLYFYLLEAEPRGLQRDDRPTVI
jgi:hypothetical protein